MQWAQRSRECPLCFKGLQLEVRHGAVWPRCLACWLPPCALLHRLLCSCTGGSLVTQLPPAVPCQDEDMNELLPFGEYISPEQRAAEAASLETWELERLLLRLAAASQREQHRQHRSSRRATTGGSGGSSSRHRRQGSRGEASAPQPIRGSEAAAVAAAEGGSAGGWAIAGEGSGGSAAAGGRPGSAPGPTFHGSWPPPAGLQASSSGGLQDEGHVVSPGSGRSSSLSLKSRLASLRLRWVLGCCRAPGTECACPSRAASLAAWLVWGGGCGVSAVWCPYISTANSWLPLSCLPLNAHLLAFLCWLQDHQRAAELVFTRQQWQRQRRERPARWQRQRRERPARWQRCGCAALGSGPAARALAWLHAAAL